MATLSAEYASAHKAVWDAFGPAKMYSCIECSGQAFEWALQEHRDALIDSNGFQYSLDPEDYRPMCRRCHRLLDYAHTEQAAKNTRISAAREALVAEHKASPGFNTPTRICHGCGMISNAAAIGNHQRASGHQGWTQEP